MCVCEQVCECVCTGLCLRLCVSAKGRVVSVCMCLYICMSECLCVDVCFCSACVCVCLHVLLTKGTQSVVACVSVFARVTYERYSVCCCMCECRT